ncbi:hypothetical protein [Tumebacillus lipolyticus]|uniref:Beta-carotene 15,15'-monooxygenase n=1 Tax=Tumebacillus lipolyticus TaxID=1280370 RepID=A0ABW4ZZW9_9BACL
MSFTQFRIKPMQWFFLLAILIAGADYAALQVVAKFPGEESAVALGVALDLTFTIPLLYYFLIVRKHKKSWLTVLPIFFLGTLVGKYILPASQREFFDLLIYLAPAIEAGLLIFLLLKIRKLIDRFRVYRQTEFHGLDALRKALGDVFGKSRLVEMLAMELGMIYYAFHFGKPQQVQRDRVEAFTYHKDTSIKALVIVFVGITLLETVLFHLVIELWSVVAAWVATASSLYAILFLIGYYKSVKHSPILVSEEVLYLRIGFTSHAVIDKQNIASVQRIPFSYEEKRDKQAFYAVLFFEEPQLEIKLHQPAIVHGPFGMRTVVSRVLLKVDDSARFLRALEEGKGA